MNIHYIHVYHNQRIVLLLIHTSTQMDKFQQHCNKFNVDFPIFVPPPRTIYMHTLHHCNKHKNCLHLQTENDMVVEN